MTCAPDGTLQISPLSRCIPRSCYLFSVENGDVTIDDVILGSTAQVSMTFYPSYFFPFVKTIIGFRIGGLKPFLFDKAKIAACYSVPVAVARSVLIISGLSQILRN